MTIKWAGRARGIVAAQHELSLETGNLGRVRPVCTCGYRGTSSNAQGKAMGDGNQHLRRVGAPVVSDDKPSFMWSQFGKGKR